MNLPVDFKAREEALDITKSFGVSAPAGSGKTELLIQRYLKLLAQCEYPESVLCLTFTRKAAAEMRSRVRLALLAAQENQPMQSGHHAVTRKLSCAVLDRDNQKGWRLLENMQRLDITTIDSYCRRIVRLSPRGDQTGLLGGTIENALPHYVRAVRSLIPSIDGGDPVLSQSVSVLLKHLDNDHALLERLLSELLGTRDQWLFKIFSAQSAGARTYFDGVLCDLTNSVLKKLHSELLPFESAIVDLIRYATGNLEMETDLPDARLMGCSQLAFLPDPVSSAINLWEGLGDLFLTSAGEWRKQVNKTTGFPAGANAKSRVEAKEWKDRWSSLLSDLQSIPDAHGLLRRVRELPGSGFTDSNWELVHALSVILPSLAAHLDVVFNECGESDFTGVALGALKALGSCDDFEDVLLRLDYKIKHILVDEFQDTSTAQMALLSKLTSGWVPDDGRTLFVVGDAMQSIYSFRSAIVGLFMRVREQGVNNIDIVPLDLQTNFRSKPGIIDWVNATFSEAFPKTSLKSVGAVPYSPSIAADEDCLDGHVTCTAFVNAKDRNRESEEVVKIVRELRSKFRNESIAILVRSRTHLQHILPGLKEVGLRYQASDIEPLCSRQEVLDILTLARVLRSPEDRMAWLSFLRAPWCGLTKPDLYSLVNTPLDSNPVLRDGFASIPVQLERFREIHGLSEDGKLILSRVAPVVLRALSERRVRTFRQSVYGLWLALGGPVCVPGYSERENVMLVLKLLSEYEHAGRIADWSVFLEALSRLYARPDADCDPNLHILTCHRAKGLEFDHVILPGLDLGARSDTRPLLLCQENLDEQGADKLLMAGLPGPDESSRVYEFLRSEEKEKRRLEETRLLYVSCTRAVRSLNLLANIEQGDDGKIKPAPSGSLLCPIQTSFLSAANLEDCGKNGHQSLANVEVNSLERIKPSCIVPEIIEVDVKTLLSA